VLHIDSLGTADPIPFGVDGNPPFVVIRVHPLAGDLCKFSVGSTDPNDLGDEDIDQTAAISSKAVRTSKFLV
jgi:protein ECT2